jgi:hypothetical protein
MNPLLIGPISDIIGRVIDRVLPDQEAASQAKQNLAQMNKEELKEILSTLSHSDTNQTEINKLDATSSDRFQSRWRPFFGWTCGVSFAYSIVAQPFLDYILRVSIFLSGTPLKDFPALPAVNENLLVFALTGILGLGAYRTYEKVKPNI